MAGSLFFYRNIKAIFISFFLLFFVSHIIFQSKTQDIKPNVYIIPPVPNKSLANILALGDVEFYFRAMALRLQNAGDTFGRFVPLKYYNYQELYNWFKFMDSLNSDSKMIPSLASYYYAQTQNRKDNKYIVKYLEEHADLDIDKHWWWMYQAIYVAKDILKDNKLALKLAYKLSKNNNPDAPLWTKQIPAFFHAKEGQNCQAFFIINSILKDHESGKRLINSEEMDFMRHFIRDRLKDFKETKFDPRACYKKK